MTLRRSWSIMVLVADELGGSRDRKQDLDGVLAALEEYSPAVIAEKGKLGARLWVRASDALSAAAEAVGAWQAAARRAGLPEREPVRVDVASEEEFHSELDTPSMPVLVGISEIARLLSVSKARASELARTATGFPRPVAQLASGPVWTEPSVLAFLTQWSRRPGRPRRESTQLARTTTAER